MTRKVTEGLEERRSRLGGAGLFFVCFVVVCLFVLIFRWIYIYPLMCVRDIDQVKINMCMDT